MSSGSRLKRVVSQRNRVKVFAASRIDARPLQQVLVVLEGAGIDPTCPQRERLVLFEWKHSAKQLRFDMKTVWADFWIKALKSNVLTSRFL
jgi:hypothetical protein